jgi:hypothetical protein
VDKQLFWHFAVWWAWLVWVLCSQLLCQTLARSGTCWQYSALLRMSSFPIISLALLQWMYMLF